MSRARPRFLPPLGLTVLLITAAVALATAYVTERRPRQLPPEIARIDVVTDGPGAPALTVAGRHLDRAPQALLIPNPALGAGDPRVLAPHLALFQLDTDGVLALASARGQRIVSIDVSEGAQPRLLGALEIGKNREQTYGVTALLRLGDRAIVSFGRGHGLVLLDIANPAAMRELDSLPSQDSLTDMLAVDGLIVAAGVRSGLWQIRIEGDRLRPVARRAPCRERAQRAAGNRVVAASLEGELALFEVARTGTLSLVGRQRIPGEIRGVTLGDRALHLCLDNGVLREFSTTSWPRLVPGGELRLPGRPLRLVRGEGRPLLVCTLVGVGAALIDTARPGHPAVAGWLATNSPISDLAVIGDRIAYVNVNGLKIRRIDNLLSQQQLAVDFPIDQRREKVQLLTWEGAPVVFDYERAIVLERTRPEEAGAPAAPEAPVALPGRNEVRVLARRGSDLVRTGSLPVTGTVAKVLVRGGFLYALTDTSLEIFAWGEAGGGEKLGRLEAFTGARAVDWLDPEYLLVVDRSGGLKLVSVRDAAAPRLVMEKPVPAFLKEAGGGSYDVVVNGRRAYVARGVLGVEVLDVSTPEQPLTLQLMDTPGRVHALALHGALLLANDRGRGLQVIETRGEYCRLLGTIAATGFIESLALVDDELLVNSAVGAISRLRAPARLGRLAPADNGDERFALPDGLPAGRYQLILYDDRQLARAELALP